MSQSKMNRSHRRLGERQHVVGRSKRPHVTVLCFLIKGICDSPEYEDSLKHKSISQNQTEPRTGTYTGNVKRTILKQKHRHQNLSF